MNAYALLASDILGSRQGYEVEFLLGQEGVIVRMCNTI